MGNAYSRAKALVDSTINDSIRVALNSTQNCNVSTNNVLSGTQFCSNCNVCIQVIRGIEFNANAYVNQECVANFKVDADVERQLRENFEQTATAIIEGLNIGVNSTDAKVITHLMVNLSTSISSSLEQAVNTVVTNLISLQQYASDCELASQSMFDITFNSFTQTVQQATMKTATNVKVYNDLDIAIKQVAEAKTKGLDLNFLAVLIAGVIVVIVVFVYSGQQVVRGLLTTVPGMIITLVLIYLVTAYFAGFFPFSPETDEESDVIRLPCSIDDDCVDLEMSCVDGVCVDVDDGN